MAIPESIKKKKPTEFGALEIRCFGDGKYYVYQITSKWDAEKNRPKKVTGKSIGKITEADGFILNSALITSRTVFQRPLPMLIPMTISGVGHS